MKLQYLGDSKDAFKWDYLDFLMQKLRAPVLHIVPMLTRDDGKDGKTSPREFAASEAVLRFCCDLRQSPQMAAICRLPEYTRGDYDVRLVKNEELFHRRRGNYFSGVSCPKGGVLFIDPDIGVEPKKPDERHILFSEINDIYKDSAEDAVLVLFQHFRRVNFERDYNDIKNRLPGGCCSTALYWNGRAMLLMFGKSSGRISAVRRINQFYPKLSDGLRIISAAAV